MNRWECRPGVLIRFAYRPYGCSDPVTYRTFIVMRQKRRSMILLLAMGEPFDMFWTPIHGLSERMDENVFIGAVAIGQLI